MGNIRNRIAERLNESAISYHHGTGHAQFEAENFNDRFSRSEEQKPGFLDYQLFCKLQSVLGIFPFRSVLHIETCSPSQYMCCLIFVFGLLSCFYSSHQLDTIGTVPLDRNSPVTAVSRSCSAEERGSNACIDLLMVEGLATSISLLRNLSDKECLEVVSQCEAAVASGVGQIQLWLANGYEQGLCGRPVDEAAAARYLQLSADLGIAEAQYNLALYYADGTGGLARDDETAARYLRLAAEQGLTEALRRLSRQHKLGVGVIPVDREAARRYWNLAVNATQQGGTGGKRLRLKWRRRRKPLRVER